MWKIKVGSEIIILVLNNKYTWSGEKESGQIFSHASTGCPFFKTAIWIPAIICIFVANCSYRWCSQPLGVQLPPRGSNYRRNTSACAAHCDKTEGGREDSLAHQIIAPASHVPAVKGRSSGTGRQHLLWGCELEHSFHYLLMHLGRVRL